MGYLVRQGTAKYRYFDQRIIYNLPNTRRYLLFWTEYSVEYGTSEIPTEHQIITKYQTRSISF